VYENWPRWEDPSNSKAKPYPGWPVEFQQSDNYGKKAVAYLPTLNISGLRDPVIQIIDEQTEKILYTIRVNSRIFHPKVFKKGLYTIKVGEPGTDMIKILSHIQATGIENKNKIEIDLNIKRVRQL
jgi:hypothetical protein